MGPGTLTQAHTEPESSLQQLRFLTMTAQKCPKLFRPPMTAKVHGIETKQQSLA